MSIRPHRGGLRPHTPSSPGVLAHARSGRLRRRAVLLAALLALAACDDDPPPAAGSVPPPTLPPATTPATRAEDVVVSVAYEGGFAPVEMLFARTPVALITGDDRALSTDPVPEIFPGPLLPDVLERSITGQATDVVVALADELGLLADISYARNDSVADAPDTVVTITVDGTTYEHRAYALGIDDTDDPDRDRLMQFVAAMTDLPGTVGDDQLGSEEPFVPDAYLIRATPVDPATLSVDVEPTILDWPADAPVRLADAAECAELPSAIGEALFTDATTLTFFTDGAVTFQLYAVPRIPGRTC